MRGDKEKGGTRKNQETRQGNICIRRGDKRKGKGTKGQERRDI